MAGHRRRGRANSTRRKECRDRIRPREHPVGLVRREVLQDGNARQKEQRRQGNARFRPEIRDEEQRGHDSRDDDDRKCRVGRVRPQHGGYIPEALEPDSRGANRLEISAGRQNAALSDESLNLKQQRVECRQKDHAERAKKQPARPEKSGRNSAAREWKRLVDVAHGDHICSVSTFALRKFTLTLRTLRPG